MDIVIHGTKGGRKIFTPKKIGGLIDVTADRCLTSAIGQEAFAIRFIENSIIFSKYKIIRDVSGEKRIGFLAFSIFLSTFEKLSGADIINALNKLSNEYCKRYIPDNDDNLDEVKEDWTFLDLISDDYKNKIINLPLDDIQKMLSGTKDDGYIYYINVEELQNYFNFPHQDIYSKFRQVLFVNVELKDKEKNPLNALRHSEENLTGKIDLDNPKYKLLFKQNYNDGARIEVKVNGIPQISSYRMNRKDELAIKWLKNYCESKEIKGRLGEISDHYIEINHNSATVVIKEILLSEEKKVINVTVKDWKGNKLDNVIVSCKNGDLEKNLNENNQIIFTGYDLSKKWSIDAKKDRIFSEPQTIDFEKSFIEIVLNKHKINITAKDSNNGEVIKEIKINKREFTSNELEISHEINVTNKDYDECTFSYHPLESDINQHIVLKRKQSSNRKNTTYLVDPGEHGRLKNGNEYTSNHINGSDVKDKIIPNKGYELIGFNENSGKIVAQYKKSIKFYEKSQFLAGIFTIIVFIVLLVVVLILNLGDNEPQPSPEPTKANNTDSIIKNYINGNELLIDTLKYYRDNNIVDNNLILILDSAIEKRSILDSKNFNKIDKVRFSSDEKMYLKKIFEIFKEINKKDTLNIQERLDSISFKKLFEIDIELVTIKESINNRNEQTEVTNEQSTSSKKLNTNVSSNIENEKKYEEEFRQKIKNESSRIEFMQLKRKVENVNSLKNSTLKRILDKICINDQNFQKFSNIGGKAGKSLEEIEIAYNSN